jgi:hypothetical protein
MEDPPEHIRQLLVDALTARPLGGTAGGGGAKLLLPQASSMTHMFSGLFYFAGASQEYAFFVLTRD